MLPRMSRTYAQTTRLCRAFELFPCYLQVFATRVATCNVPNLMSQACFWSCNLTIQLARRMAPSPWWSSWGVHAMARPRRGGVQCGHPPAPKTLPRNSNWAWPSFAYLGVACRQRAEAGQASSNVDEKRHRLSRFCQVTTTLLSLSLSCSLTLLWGKVDWEALVINDPTQV